MPWNQLAPGGLIRGAGGRFTYTLRAPGRWYNSFKTARQQCDYTLLQPPNVSNVSSQHVPCFMNPWDEDAEDGDIRGFEELTLSSAGLGAPTWPCVPAVCA